MRNKDRATFEGYSEPGEVVVDLSDLVGNYYGGLELIKRGETYFLILENWDTCHGIEVSSEFAEATIREFPSEARLTRLKGGDDSE